ncbi:MAG: RNA polymerase factor sigma-54 [Bacteroidaceae bacterium]|nr:RNA polymerase factor sigma-54 [Bacteroidaceae bacterium]
MKQGQVQQQRDIQVQRLSPQQYLVAKLVELPVTDLEQRVRDELYENVALEEGTPADDPEYPESPDNPDNPESPDFPDSPDSPDTTLYDADDLPVYQSSRREPQAEIPIGDTRSFIEDLEAQIADYDVTPLQRQLIQYLIGSLDDRGFIDRPLQNIVDDLLFNHNIDVSPQQLADALAVLQQFDPPGIGARSLQECLLIQIDRILSETQPTPVLLLSRRIVTEAFPLFQRNDTERMARQLDVTAEQLRSAILAIGRLNPHPGRSLHEAADDRAQTIIPDFIIETDHESQVSFSLNQGEVPPLRVSPDYLQQLRTYQQAPESRMTRTQRDAYTYTRQKVEAAQMFVQAILQRHHTLSATMKAIIALQRDFMLTQDDAQLHPLRLDDVAQRTGLNISTVSRVVASKYALLDGTLYPLKHFFLRSKTNAEGQLILKTHVYPLLRQLIDEEDKRNPLSDEQLSVLMRQHGQPISRRTVAKYRDEMNIPTATLRRRM